MNLKEKKIFIYNTVQRKLKKNGYNFTLMGKNVCRRMYLNTLGYKTFNAIESILKNKNLKSVNNVIIINDKKNIKVWNKHTVEFNKKIDDFILSFNPTKSHYRINHSPNRRYFDASLKLNASKLYKEFCKVK